MRRMILNRLLLSVPVLFLMTIITYLLVSLIRINAARLSAQMHLDRPFYVQWWYLPHAPA